MENNIVITIARQYGSGGREIGRRVAEKLGILYLDKKILLEAVTESGIHPDLVRYNDEKAGNPLGQAFAAGGMHSYFNSESTINDKVFQAESEAIKKFAKQGSCVIIGRCASYVLRHEVRHLSVFINADLDDRIQRAIHQYGEPEKRIRERLAKQDKQRAHYHSYYTDERWMDLEQYDLTLNSSSVGLENAADLIIQAAKYRCRSI
ncbi:MAG: cytidylate kinase-like family protein [Oscillospiraceae bacterium]|nr:cytidylate kinase-like family protein [Oscillospiraceae bacterium]